jgi:hypothetical protein
MVLLTGVFPLILVLYGNPEPGIILSGYLGLLLLATAFVAVGLLTSSLTDNQIIAAVSCLVALLLLYVISWPADNAGAGHGRAAEVRVADRAFRRDGQGRHRHARSHVLRQRHCLRPCSSRSARSSRCAGGSRVRRSNGLLGLIGVILLVFAIAAWFLTPLLPSTTDFATIYIAVHAVAGLLAIIAYLTTGLENLRSFVGERSTRYGTSTVLASLIFFLILVLVNFLAYRHHRRFDLSSEKVYSLSPQSVQVLNGLNTGLTMDAFVEGGTNPELDDLLKNYSTASSKVTYRLIDPDREPELTERYGVKAYNTVRIAYGDASNQVTQPTEESITNALIKLTRTGKQVVVRHRGPRRAGHRRQGESAWARPGQGGAGERELRGQEGSAGEHGQGAGRLQHRHDRRPDSAPSSARSCRRSTPTCARAAACSPCSRPIAPKSSFRSSPRGA